MRLVDLVHRYLDRLDPPRPLRRSARAEGRTLAPNLSDRIREAGLTPELSPFISDWPEEWREVFEERAGIMEFDGGLDRQEAESKAAYWTRFLHRHGQGERFGRPEERP